MRRAILGALLGVLAHYAAAQDSKSATLYADKIYCEACAAVITKSLRNVPGVSAVRVDVEKKEIVVRFDPTKAKMEDLTAATAKRGFPSTVKKAAL